MKAAVAHDFRSPLIVEEREVPPPGADQVLVRMEACGLCHTDIHAAHGDWPIKAKLPLVPGHEGVSSVESLGPHSNRGVEVGDRVAIPWLGYACGNRCCNDGRETLCEQQLNPGYFNRGRLRRVLASGDEGARRRRPALRRAGLRRRDDVHSGQGLRRALLEPGGDLRRGRPRPHGDQVPTDRRARRRRARRS